MTGWCAPRKLCTGRPGWSVGSWSTDAFASCCRQYASCRSSSSPCSVSRCHTAKSAYWIGSSAKRRRVPRAERRVQRRQLAEEHTHRPAIADDVMHGEEQNVVVLGHVQQRRPDNGPLARSNGRCASSVARRTASASRAAAGRARRSTTGSDSVSAGATTCTVRRQTIAKVVRIYLVPPHNLVEAGGERGHIQRKDETERCGFVVERTSWRELIEKPQPLLSKREGKTYAS